MGRTLSARLATIVLVATLAAPAFAAPRRDDSPVGTVERAITRVIKQIRNLLPLTDINIPKP